MWLVSNRTPYVAERSWLQDKDANKIWLVVVKATFDILPNGSTRLSQQQVPVHRVALPEGELGRSSLAQDADLSGVKPGTDVLVRGSALAPAGKRARWVDVRLTAGPVNKRLRVFGDRLWERGLAGLAMSEPEPFESMPITFERAYGGWDRSSDDPAEHRMDERNPVGTGFAVRAENCAGMRLPNVELPDRLIRSWKDRPGPAGFNVVDCCWSPRRELAGTYDEAWHKRRFPLWAKDFDPRYAQCAPCDQQMKGYLHGGEPVEVVGMSRGGTIAFVLPRIYPFFRTRFGREQVEHRAQLCTVLVEPDFPRVVMVWQTSMICNQRVDDLDETVVTEKRMILGRGGHA